MTEPSSIPVTRVEHSESQRRIRWMKQVLVYPPLVILLLQGSLSRAYGAELSTVFVVASMAIWVPACVLLWRRWQPTGYSRTRLGLTILLFAMLQTAALLVEWWWIRS